MDVGGLMLCSKVAGGPVGMMRRFEGGGKGTPGQDLNSSRFRLSAPLYNAHRLEKQKEDTRWIELRAQASFFQDQQFSVWGSGGHMRASLVWARQT